MGIDKALMPRRAAYISMPPGDFGFQLCPNSCSGSILHTD